MGNINYSKIVKRFDRLAKQGIQTKEVEAAKTCLMRELGRQPTLLEVVKFLEQYIAWRREIRMWENGEIVRRIEYTKKGRWVKSIAERVNDILHKKGGE